MRFIYPTNENSDIVHIVIKETEGGLVVRAFSSPPPREALIHQPGEEVTTLEVALDFMDLDEMS